MSTEDDDVSECLKPPAFVNGPLFDIVGEWPEVADLDSGANFHYIEGYRRAALLVANQAAETAFDADQLVYPLVFLYRHVIELAVKQLLEMFGDARATHDIQELWNAVRPLLAGEGFATSELDTVAERLLEFHAIDERATGFRYPYLPSKGDDPLIRSVKGGFNVRAFSERADSLCDVLGGYEAGIDAHRDWRHEMEAEWREYEQEHNQP